MDLRGLRLWFSRPSEIRIRTGGTKNRDLQLCGFVQHPSLKTEFIDFTLKKTDNCILQFETPISGKIDVKITSHEAICEDEKCHQFLKWNSSSREGKIKALEGGRLPTGIYVINNILKIVYHQSQNYDQVSDARVILYEGTNLIVALSQAFGECIRKNPSHLFCEHCRLPEKIQPNKDFTELAVTMNEPDKEYVYNIGCWEDAGWQNNLTWFTKVNFYEAEKQQNEKYLDDELAHMSEEESTKPSDIVLPSEVEAEFNDLRPTKKEPIQGLCSGSFRTNETEKGPQAIRSTVIPFGILLLGILLGIIFLAVTLLVMSCCIYCESNFGDGTRINLFQHIKEFLQRRYT